MLQVETLEVVSGKGRMFKPMSRADGGLQQAAGQQQGGSRRGQQQAPSQTLAGTCRSLIHQLSEAVGEPEVRLLGETEGHEQLLGEPEVQLLGETEVQLLGETEGQAARARLEGRSSSCCSDDEGCGDLQGLEAMRHQRGRPPAAAIAPAAAAGA
jgi:hypothetical protein